MVFLGLHHVPGVVLTAAEKALHVTIQKVCRVHLIGLLLLSIYELFMSFV